MSAKLIYQDVSPGADTDAIVSASGSGSKSNTSLLPFGVVNPDFASLEMNKWGGTGAVKVYDGDSIALVSSAMSGATGSFSSPPTLTINFAQNHTSLGVSFRFASNAMDYATSLTISWYQGATLLSQKTFASNATTYFCENTVTAYNKLVIAINATNLPYRYARIEQILFGLVREFDGYEIGSVDILQQVNLISAELAINTLDWSLKSRSGVDFIFQLKQPVMAYNGNNLLGVFYISDKAKRTSEKSYEIPCIDAIGVLDGDTFTATMYSNKNAVTLMREIVNGAFELDIDPSFSAATVTGLIHDGSRRSAFHQVAFAIGAMVDTAGTKKIRVRPAPTAVASIPESRVYVGGSVTQDAIVTAVIVTYHTYTQGSGSSGDDVVTVGGVKYVHTTGTVRVNNPNVTSADKQNVKEVKEATLVNATNAAAVAARVYAYYQRRNTVSTKFVVSVEKPGDRVSVPTAWGDTMTGNIESMKIKLSNTTAADITAKTEG